MNILMPGVLPEDHVFRMNCSHCKAIFEVTRAEGRVVSGQRDGDFLSITCPTAGCKKECTSSLNNGRAPKQIWRNPLSDTIYG